MARTLIETIVLTIGLGGFYSTFVQFWQWHHGSGGQISVAARRRRTAARAQAWKDRYGGGPAVAVTALLILSACLLLACLFALVACVSIPCVVFHDNGLCQGISSLGMLLWFRRFSYWFGRRFL